MELTKEQREEYVRNPSGQCPFCKNYSLNSGAPILEDDSEVIVPVKCSSCGEKWNSEYSLSGIHHEPKLEEGEYHLWYSQKMVEQLNKTWPGMPIYNNSPYILRDGTKVLSCLQNKSSKTTSGWDDLVYLGIGKSDKEMFGILNSEYEASKAV
jgi:hypothetical protein